MASTKYTPVPRDSTDETAGSSYTQAPPGYQAEAQEALLGAARSEYDNVPDDFKVSATRRLLGGWLAVGF